MFTPRTRRLKVLTTAFVRDRGGAVAITSAFALPVLLGCCALVAEYGHGLLTRAQNQRIADLASYAGAIAYTQTKDKARMTSAAAAVARLNGISPSDVSVNLVASPKGGSNQAVQATVNVERELLLAPILGSFNELKISTTAFAQIGSEAAACIMSLNGSKNVGLTGSSNINATNCSVASNASFAAECGTLVEAKTINFGTTASSSCAGRLKSTQISKATVTDPLAGNSGVALARSRFATLQTFTPPSAPVTPTKPKIDFSQWGDINATKAKFTSVGCTANLSGVNWTITCPGLGPYSFGALDLPFGISVDFNSNGNASAVYNFNGSISNSGKALKFGSGTFNISGNVKIGADGASISFGAGTFNIGSGTCHGPSFSVCAITNTSITFGGPSSFNLVAGVQNGGRIVMGAGSSNSFDIGASSTGDSFRLVTRTTTILADANARPFRLHGHMNGEAATDSCLMIGAADHHDIKGNFLTAGAVVMGAGVYTIDGHMALAPIGGGQGNCPGQTSVFGENITIVLSGKTTYPTSDCRGLVFCAAGAFQGVTIKAPTTGPYANLAIIGPETSAGAGLRTGTTTQINGAFYLPNGHFRMDGNAALSSGTGCFNLVSSSLEFWNNARVTAGTSCFGAGGGAGGQVSLVQ